MAVSEEDALATAMERQMRLDSSPIRPERKENYSDKENEKLTFDESMNEEQKKESFNARRVISLGHLPPLPMPEGESELYEPVDEDDGYDERSDGHMDTVDESQMQRHLDNVDSSFLSGPSYVGKNGDDSYAEGANGSRTGGGRARTPESQKERLDGIQEESSFVQSENSPCAGRGTGHELSRRDDESASVSGGETTAELETMSSPRTAAEKTVSRAISMASMGYDVTGHEVGTYDNRSDSDRDEKSDEEIEYPSGTATPRPKSVAQNDGGNDSDSGKPSNLRHQTSNESLNAKDAGRTPGQALRQRALSKPRFLRSRNNSQRSSISTSVPMNLQPDDEGDAYGADYAMLSGGCMPQDAPSMARHGSQMLSRTISLGSIASGIEDDFTPLATPLEIDRQLGPVDEEGMNETDVKSEPETTKDFETPKATRSFVPPTDTVLARHVRSVNVPDSAAKEYKNRPGMSPVKTGAAIRQGHNMTLKEQSSTIERLSRENYDLKLRVMFLDDKLSKLSEEGVKELISENVELKTVMANLQRDNKALRKKVKDLEKEKDKDEETRPNTAASGASSDDPRHQWFQQENEEKQEEIEFLRQRIAQYDYEFERMRTENLARETEKRQLAEIVKTMSDKRGEHMEASDEMDVWKELHAREEARREQADEENRKLRDEIFRLKSENALSQSGRQSGAAGSVHGLPSMNHTTNIYNITKKKREVSPSRPFSGMSEQPSMGGGAFSAASTLVEELRNESERLRHENAELRREVGAQTSMLTSRNREKERLYQEIEDLKLGHRRGSIAGDSILERSASRSNMRPVSRGSAMTRMTSPPEDIEELELKIAELRDNLNAMKLTNQELTKELESCSADFETAIEAKREVEGLAAELEGELQATGNDVVTMQTERDEALRNVEDLETEFESLRKEAQDEIDALEAEAEQRMVQLDSLQLELTNTTENFNALQNEMREMSEAVVRLEDDHDVKSRRIQELEKEVEDGNRELDELEKALGEAREKISRLEVQQESSQGEIAFLREEQDADKVKIGDLETLVKNYESAVRDEKERVRELEQRLQSEREQRELVAGQEKQEVQRYINDLNREASGAKDEARRLRKSLGIREVEATEWKERLMELENNLRQALGDLNGTHSSFVKGITDLQRQLDDATRELLSTRDAVLEKERLIKQRDNLLENHGLESRKLADMLEKERQAHRSTRHQHENSLQAQHHTTRTISQQEARVLHLENALSHDRKKLAQVENAFKDAMLERNNLLLALWNRLSGICGSDWAHNNSLINGRALPSMEAISGQMFGGFAKNLVASVKMVESIILGFRSKIKQVEKQLWKEMHNLESTFEQRTTKLERLEATVKSQAMGGPGSHVEQKSEIQRLQNLNRLLRAELAANRGNSPRKGSVVSGTSSNSGSTPLPKTYTVETVPELGSPSPVVAMGPGPGSTHKNNRPEKMSRGYSEANLQINTSAMALPPLERANTTSAASVRSQSGANQTPSKFATTNQTDFGGSTSTYRGIGAMPHHQPTNLRKGLDESMPEGLSSEEAWEWRMQEMERRLREEREGRRLDRRNAQRRLEEEGRARREVEERGRRERGRESRASGASASGAIQMRDH